MISTLDCDGGETAGSSVESAMAVIAIGPMLVMSRRATNTRAGVERRSDIKITFMNRRTDSQFSHLKGGI